ncbi:hypothetical protein GCM10010197_30600 [Nocardioides luteus]|uniref:Uncharacterized protein n=2 Tax=Nocardioides luteus TaxID=1844 RepID=A0ABQ5ST27_9ACTN|nr:hypothetical protein GCM10010197_30600 [Nocardioides luteus]GLJ67297.1 hypothetical protein GCM10017579_13330 [Nocardioides luteus]
MLTVVVIFVAMFLIVALAGLVIVYTVFPHRGQKMPYASRIGDAMERAVDTAPTLGPATRLQQRRDNPLADLMSDPRRTPKR